MDPTVPQSLIPYLDPERAQFYLRISLRSDDLTILETPQSPWLIINESDPLTCLIDAQILTDAGSRVRSVFVLVQKDEYHLARDELWPVSNQDVDQCWQKAFSVYSEKGQDDSCIILADQIRKDGGLAPFQSLFYCKRKRVFFHPPCPTCGLPLQQCYDDDLLTKVGLQPYSTSLKRYLFCPSCFGSSGESDFWLSTLENFDLPTIKDQWHLIREFGQLTDDKIRDNQFPCTGCELHQACYGAEGLSVSRVFPFSFYPFFMLIFEAPSVNALDFLSLISGSSFEDLEAHLNGKKQMGRMGCLKALREKSPVKPPFLFDGDEKHFLEVLYLKLSFLEELAKTIFARMDVVGNPDLGLSVDRIWVKLPEQSDLLPFFWNSKLKLMDIGTGEIPAKSSLIPKLAPSNGLHFLAILWFHALLVNREQDVSKVHLGLREAIDRVGSSSNETFDLFLKNTHNHTFSPENVFWIPKRKTFPEEWKRLWEKALDMGWSLLRVSLFSNPEWSKDQFCLKAEGLRQGIRDRLFENGHLMTKEAPAPEDGVIYGMLLKIMEKWRVGFGPKRDESDETILESRIELGEKTVISSQVEEEVSRETVILSSGHPGEETSPGTHIDDDIPETVVVAPSGRSAEPVTPSRQWPPKDLGVQRADTLGTKKNIDQPDEDDLLTETVILSPDHDKDKE